MLVVRRLVALFAAACCCTVSSALLLGPHPPCQHRAAAASAASRARPLQCGEDEAPSPLPEEVTKDIPPAQLAAAWQREEEAKELSTLLKGCQVYLVGLSARKIAVGRALARRLQTYRLLDAPALMLSTYKALQGGEATEELSMEVQCHHLLALHCLRPTPYSRLLVPRTAYVIQTTSHVPPPALPSCSWQANLWRTCSSSRPR